MKGEKTRQQFITTAERLFQREGYHGVGLSQLIRESGAPKGSFYFHFPGGKLELAVLTVERSSADVRRLLVEARKASRSAMAYSERIISALKAWLIETDYAGGCAVASMTLEMAGTSDELADACGDAYQEWIGEVADALIDYGVGATKAKPLATLMIAALEGAVVVCRARRSTEALNATRATLRQILRD